jgi:hypothetical protein
LTGLAFWGAADAPKAALKNSSKADSKIGIFILLFYLR